MKKIKRSHFTLYQSNLILTLLYWCFSQSFIPCKKSVRPYLIQHNKSWWIYNKQKDAKLIWTCIRLVFEYKQAARHQCYRKRKVFIQLLVNPTIWWFTDCISIVVFWCVQITVYETRMWNKVHNNRWSKRQDSHYWLISRSILVWLLHQYREWNPKYKKFTYQNSNKLIYQYSPLFLGQESIHW